MFKKGVFLFEKWFFFFKKKRNTVKKDFFVRCYLPFCCYPLLRSVVRWRTALGFRKKRSFQKKEEEHLFYCLLFVLWFFYLNNWRERFFSGFLRAGFFKQRKRRNGSSERNHGLLETKSGSFLVVRSLARNKKTQRSVSWGSSRRSGSFWNKSPWCYSERVLLFEQSFLGFFEKKRFLKNGSSCSERRSEQKNILFVVILVCVFKNKDSLVCLEQQNITGRKKACSLTPNKRANSTTFFLNEPLLEQKNTILETNKKPKVVSW